MCDRRPLLARTPECPCTRVGGWCTVLAACAYGHHLRVGAHLCVRACSGPISICACSVSVSVGWCFQGCLCLSCLCPSVAKSVCTCGCLHMCAVDEDLLVCPVLSWAHLCRACIHVHTPALGTGVPWCARSRRVLMLPCAKSAPRPFDSEQILLLMLCLSPGLDIRSHVTKSTSKGDDGGYASPGGGGREASKPGSS